MEETSYMSGGYNGYIYTLDLSSSFNSSSNFSNVLDTMSIATTAGSNLASTYVDGVMFANNDEYYTYAGLPIITGTIPEGSKDQIIGYEAYQYGPEIENWNPRFYIGSLPDNVTNYVTNGAGVSAPSENLGFYFSGLHAQDWSPIAYNILNTTFMSDRLVTVNMSVMEDEKWSNDTLPSYVPSRADAELVWVPVSDSGVLVAIGGVINPGETYLKLNSTQETDSEEVSPTFMETVSVYDIESKTWYLQNTTGDTPPQLAEFCSVLASASDDSSHNIYIYGGYNGMDTADNPSDDVYILSLPSFTWVKVYNGTNTHGRARQKCVKVYPDQMLSIGGYRIDETHCLEGGMIADFNLNNLSFQDSYDPSQWSDYKVPDLLSNVIGGDSSGGATTTSPSSSWTNSSLAKVFDTKYAKTINTYWPYNTTSSDNDSGSHHHKSFPKWAAAVIGVLLGLLVVILAVVGLWFFLRRRQRRYLENEKEREPGPSEADGTERLTTMYGGGPVSPVPGPQSTSTGQETSTGAQTTHTHDSIATSASPATVESGGGIVHEMHDSSPVELPTAFNASSTNTNDTSHFSATRVSSPSPISPSTPDTDSSHSLLIPGHHRTLSTRSIDNVVTSRKSYFHESLEGNTGVQHTRHGSEVSEASDTSNNRTNVGGSETIFE
ncbi:hypothetical protein N7456_008237 [Penicillium angulare]|uniref:Galactose oxidase/kelch, beta-propeller n=1 Tax=Penicillium angulare TaxID=116970 RepID=A0A9W9K9G9_9EURO|nr:hypothetical protein N7456_008237 [Penicillium angulare]